VMQLSTKALLPTPGHALVPGTNYSPVRGLPYSHPSPRRA
jgi:hypothetical protein